MKGLTDRIRNLLLLFLAVIFSAALMFGFIELPRWIDSLLQQSGSFPGFDHGLGEDNAYMAEVYIDALYLRWIGYGSLLLVLLFIVLGFVTRKSSWAWAGAFVIFLPVFGQFALSMFFLSGLGILRTGWLPLIESRFPLLELGMVIYAPYWVLMWFFGLFNWEAHNFISWLFMSTGAFLFVWGVFTWLQDQFQHNGVSTNWLYRFSRHPQYLGWILWSYGLMLFSIPENPMKRSWSIQNSLPFLLATMIIISICMLEELSMQAKYGEEFEAYRNKAPFLFPMPKWLNRIMTYPGRLITGGRPPVNKKQVASTILLYTLIFMGLSLFWVDFPVKSEQDTMTMRNSAQREEIINRINSESDRRTLSRYFVELGSLGDSAVRPLILFLEDEDPVKREFAADQLGNIGNPAALEPLIAALGDENWRVINSASGALGNLGDRRAVPAILQLLEGLPPPDRCRFYGVLGKLHADSAWPYLVEGTGDERWYVRNSALVAMADIDFQKARPFVFEAIYDTESQVKRKAVLILMERKPADAIPHLMEVVDDSDFETRFYARQAVRLIREETND